MNILITGGAGFIGSHLVEELIQYNNIDRIIIIDDLSTGKTENIIKSDKIIFYKADISNFQDIEKLLNNYRFDYVFHLAAIASVQASIDNPVYTHKVNFDSVLYLIEYFKDKNLKKFVFASSAAVYGNKPDLPANENSKVNPISPYGVDKYSAERYVINAFNLFNFPGLAFRFFNVYGPRQNPSSPYSGVLSIFKDRISRDMDLIVFGDGNQTRDFIFVKDLVKCIIDVSMNTDIKGEVFNLGTGTETSLNDVIKIFRSISNKNFNVIYKEERAGDIKRSYADNKKILEVLKKDFIFKSINEGLKIYFES